jgi:predicted metal-dependent hydrolase
MAAKDAGEERTREASPSMLALAIDQFNQGEYFECHETLEALWLAEAEPLRRFYQGILQVGVALYHQRRGNYRGASRLLESGIGYLLPFEPECLGIDVRGFVRAAVRCRDHLAQLGPERIHEFDTALVPRLTRVAVQADEEPRATGR